MGLVCLYIGEHLYRVYVYCSCVCIFVCLLLVMEGCGVVKIVRYGVVFDLTIFQCRRSKHVCAGLSVVVFMTCLFGLSVPRHYELNRFKSLGVCWGLSEWFCVPSQPMWPDSVQMSAQLILTPRPSCLHHCSLDYGWSKRSKNSCGLHLLFLCSPWCDTLSLLYVACVFCQQVDPIKWVCNTSPAICHPPKQKQTLCLRQVQQINSPTYFCKPWLG